MLYIAEVICAHAKCHLISGAFRVVAIDAASDIAALVRLDVVHPTSPFTVSWSALMHCIETNEIDCKQEFALDLPTSDGELSAAELAELHRVGAYFLPLLDVGLQTLVLDPTRRNEEIAKQSVKCHVHTRTIEKHFNLYLWAGMTKYALIGERNIVTVTGTGFCADDGNRCEWECTIDNLYQRDAGERNPNGR